METIVWCLLKNWEGGKQGQEQLSKNTGHWCAVPQAKYIEFFGGFWELVLMQYNSKMWRAEKMDQNESGNEEVKIVQNRR